VTKNPRPVKKGTFQVEVGGKKNPSRGARGGGGEWGLCGGVGVWGGGSKKRANRQEGETSLHPSPLMRTDIQTGTFPCSLHAWTC